MNWNLQYGFSEHCHNWAIRLVGLLPGSVLEQNFMFLAGGFAYRFFLFKDSKLLNCVENPLSPTSNLWCLSRVHLWPPCVLAVLQ